MLFLCHIIINPQERRTQPKLYKIFASVFGPGDSGVSSPSHSSGPTASKYIFHIEDHLVRLGKMTIFRPWMIFVTHNGRALAGTLEGDPDPLVYAIPCSGQ